MSDTLSVLVVVPQKLAQANRIEKINMLVATVELAYQVRGWDVKFDSKIVVVDNPDGVVYDARFCIRTNLIGNDDLRAQARLALNSAKRKAYVIFVCDSIVEADTMGTDTVRPTGTNGESITGEAISFLSLISDKSTVGNADGRTWAHEMGHGLGLGHVDDDDNLMSPSRHGQGGRITGFDITHDQIATMKLHYKELVTGGL